MSGEILIFATIWSAILLFVVGEAGKRPLASRAIRTWAWGAWAAGTLLCAAHMILSLAIRHGWSHHAALDSTAVQTDAVYGVAFGAGLYVNYIFLGAWIAETAWWRFRPRSYFTRAAPITWALRAFYFIVLLNAAVIFATRWIFGLALMSVLVWTWTPFCTSSRCR
jgi:hypothetical protein